MSDFKHLRIVHTEAATSFGGQEYRIFKEMVAMRDQGHHLEAICQPDAELTTRLREAGFTVHTMYMDGFFNIISGILKIARILRRGRFDVVNTHSRQDTIIAAPAGRLAGTSLIVRTRHLSSKVNSLLTYTWLPHAVTTVSDYVRRHLIDRGVAPDRVETIYTPLLFPPPVEHSTLRQELGLKNTDTVIGCVAVMRPNKGHRDLIDAVAPLFKSHDDLHLVLVGGGSPTFENTQDYIAQLGLEHRIHMTGARKDVPNLLAGFDIFALATREEASGTVFLEAAASGVPIVATDVGGVSEVVRRDENCLLVARGDMQAMREALARLIDDPTLRKKMGQAGSDMIWKEGAFSTRQLVERTQTVYGRWLRERKKFVKR
ncbi:glycosyltransferase family 4 protein [Orrella sp. NBD-18]|uniref:Glycosyltransferase family 4 protein n=1 Tax=Sheuella amnicola TaxID=2707330 RepID=A0A6B2R9F8_9BURK|nr:glycosyltransferase family 4 protein [Sheuella amnicola]NDY83905.1 glycosyltransferase family 4 protein [Sheuella amnicola]HBI82275.1 glycosyltransferase family 1 protein [Alcaligenaceae bacterium]